MFWFTIAFQLITTHSTTQWYTGGLNVQMVYVIERGLNVQMVYVIEG